MGMHIIMHKLSNYHFDMLTMIFQHITLRRKLGKRLVLIHLKKYVLHIK